MIIELLAVLAAGLGAACFAALVRKVTRYRLSRRSVPVAGVLAALAIAVASDYGWRDRATIGLPDGARIVWSTTDRVAYRPWTYLVPRYDRAIALVPRGGLPGGDRSVTRAELHLLARSGPDRRIDLALDCASGRRADLPPGDPRLIVDLADLDWVDVAPNDPVYGAVCSTGRVSGLARPARG